MKILVIGGTLFMGRQLVSELLKAGHEVAILHRKAKHDLGRRVENLAADRNDGSAVREAIGMRRFDVVFDNVYDWDRGTTAAHVEATLRAVETSRLTRYVFMSSVAAYGDGLNHYENDALAPDDHPDPYVRNKAQTERMLFRMHQRTGVPVVTLRPPFVYGPENPYYREAFFWDRLRAGRPIILPGDGHRLMQFAYVKDVVHACVRAATAPEAVGEAFNLGNEKPLTQSEVVRAFARAAGKTPVLRPMPRERILEAGGNPMGEPAYFGVYFDVPPITQIVTKVKRILKLQPTPFDKGLKETYRWYLRQKRQKVDYSFEDKLLSMAPAVTVEVW
jgi:nucleoside-diphosphate-sugar epimerase